MTRTKAEQTREGCAPETPGPESRLALPALRRCAGAAGTGRDGRGGGRAGFSGRAGGADRGVRQRRGCRRDRFRAGPAAGRKTASVGPGPALGAGSRPAAWRRAQTLRRGSGPAGSRLCPGCGRCALDDGGRPEMRGARRCDRRGMGRSPCARLHRIQASGAARGAHRDSGHAPALFRAGRPVRRAAALAGDLAAVRAASRRSEGARRAALAGRAVPGTGPDARRVGGGI